MLFDFDKTFRSLTAFPFASILDQAHRMAPRHLEAGGAAAGGVDGDRPTKRDFLVPRDIDPVDLAMFIEAELRRTRSSSSARPGGALSVLGASGRATCRAGGFR
jgi:hypothetical protein